MNNKATILRLEAIRRTLNPDNVVGFDWQHAARHATAQVDGLIKELKE